MSYLRTIFVSTGRVIRKDKRGAIPDRFPPLLARMGFEEKHWLDVVQEFLARYGVVAGKFEALRCYEARCDMKGVKGIGMAERLERGLAA